MEKKNTILLTVIAVATLLVAVVGATFAYFTASTTTGTGTGTAETGETTTLGSTSLDMSTVSTQGASNMSYPGGMMVAAAKVTASVTGDQTYNMTYDVKFEVDTSALSGSTSEIKYTVYRVDSAVSGDLVTGCQYHEEDEGATGKKYYYTDCAAAAGITSGTPVKTETTISEHTEKTTVTISGETFSNVKNAGDEYVYYLVVSYVNDDADDQTATDAGKTITAKFTGLANGKSTLVNQ